ncbi:Cell wall hydrolyses involved in spore germination [Lutibaculum baratangense AMV1]|uniref:Cell wall hydrolyses involved in spore germination n=2 Tax=Lutibaculum TaxID=1358438 RepID=V4RNI5_9HYPH|nr:Cell wall hydrolyses involved in spore germination [Lutibaculum baratangense AMV1]
MPVAFQDATALMDRAALASSARWKAALIADPYGSTARATPALPLVPTELLEKRPAGIRLGREPGNEVVIMQPERVDPVITGSLQRDVREFPQSTAARKGDLLMSRAATRPSLDLENGLIRRAPRLLLDSKPSAGRQSFLPPGSFEIGRPIQVASLGTDNFLIGRQYLETPMEAAIRRKRETREYLADRQCLATAIYFEARGETPRGQEAVAQVVLNRVKDERYPDSVCGVVYQNQHMRNRCQFSFACDGTPDRVRDESSWTLAMTIADSQLLGYSEVPEIGGATHYHATYVNPRWSRYLNKLERIGTHIFYALKPGQR